MTETVARAPQAPDHADTSRGTEIVIPGQRGRTLVADKVVESIATIAAGEVEAVVATRTGWADVRRGESRIAVEIATTWPLPVSRVAKQVRGHVQERVEQLTGLRVAAVDVTVDSVVEPEPGARVR